jgi:hypothetical protein
METSYTFLTTDSPSLEASGVKRMRAHVTRINFARRRQRIARQLRLDHSAKSFVEDLATCFVGESWSTNPIFDMVPPTVSMPKEYRPIHYGEYLPATRAGLV